MTRIGRGTRTGSARFREQLRNDNIVIGFAIPWSIAGKWHDSTEAEQTMLRELERTQ